MKRRSSRLFLQGLREPSETVLQISIQPSEAETKMAGHLEEVAWDDASVEVAAQAIRQLG